MADLHSLIELTIVVGGGFVGALAARAARMPVLVGYLLVGVVLGPSGLGLVRDSQFVNALAELGVVLLLFVIGAELSFRSLAQMRRAALLVAPTQIALTAALGYGVAHLLGWSWSQAATLGFVLALSSTMVVVKTLSARRELHTHPGMTMVVVLLVQDLAAILMVAALPALAGERMQALAVLGLLGKGLLLIAWVAVLSRWVIPAVLGAAARLYNKEIFVVTVAALCLGGAASVHLLGFSLALGGFAAGLAIADSRFRHEVLASAAPFRHLFSLVFFVSLGFLVDLRVVAQHTDWVLALLGATVLGKGLLAALSAGLGGYHLRTAVASGLGLAQIGEFSFLIATLAWQQGTLTNDMHAVIVAVAGISLLISPLVMRLDQPLYALLRAALHCRPDAPPVLDYPHGPALHDHIVLCGYGRVGRLVGETLLAGGHEVVVIDFDQHVIADLTAKEVPAFFGDAGNPVLLELTYPAQAKAAVVALPDRSSTRLVVRELRRLAPCLPIVARVHLRAEVDATYEEGATEVVYAEFEASLEIIRHALGALGDKPDEVQAIIDRIHSRHYRPLERPEECEVE